MGLKNQDIALISNDLFIDPIAGDFSIADSDTQHIVDNIAAFPGWWKENPTDGVGILQYENSAGQEQDIQRMVKIQLQSDGYQVNNPFVKIDSTGKLIVQTNATKL
jgi:hypothetical protein